MTLETIHVFVLVVSVLSISALIVAYWNNRKVEKVEQRIERKTARLDKLEESVKQLAEEMKNV